MENLQQLGGDDANRAEPGEASRCAELSLGDALRLLDQARSLEVRSRAAEPLLRAAEQGRSDAAVEIGKLFLCGSDFESDASQARWWFERASQRGNAEACRWLGFMGLHHLGGLEDWGQVRKHLELACEAGIAAAFRDLFWLNQMEAWGCDWNSIELPGAPGDVAESHEDSLRALLAHEARLVTAVNETSIAEGSEFLRRWFNDEERAKKWRDAMDREDEPRSDGEEDAYDPMEFIMQALDEDMLLLCAAAAGGDAVGLGMLGEFLPTIKNNDQAHYIERYEDVLESISNDLLFEASDESPRARWVLGNRLAEQERGIPESVRLLGMIAKAGHVAALEKVKSLYAEHPPDNVFAGDATVLGYFANAGIVEAQFGEGMRRFVNGDVMAGVHYIASAARNGHLEAIKRLAFFYEVGEGVKRDAALSAKWREASQTGQPPMAPRNAAGEYMEWVLRSARWNGSRYLSGDML